MMKYKKEKRKKKNTDVKGDLGGARLGQNIYCR